MIDVKVRAENQPDCEACAASRTLLSRPRLAWYFAMTKNFKRLYLCETHYQSLRMHKDPKDDTEGQRFIID